ncbi:MAG TPA: Smr/MutS family protein [Caulobacteraceae bacterium]|jgi:DNA-nicking Smr family endonuclease|nr:Smr/MutS family protein [Caulobacteraceae bacterium]
MRRAHQDQRLWAVVAATVRPLKGRTAPAPGLPPAPIAGAKTAATARAAPSAKPAPPPRSPSPRSPSPRSTAAAPPEEIEPSRLHRIDRGRDEVTAVLDLHGLDQDAARRALESFVVHHFAAHHRTVLVITGKGLLGDGVLRRRAPQWLAEPPLRAMVAGISEAHRRRGGEGALYVALKRNAKSGG